MSDLRRKPEWRGNLPAFVSRAVGFFAAVEVTYWAIRRTIVSLHYHLLTTPWSRVTHAHTHTRTRKNSCFEYNRSGSRTDVGKSPFLRHGIYILMTDGRVIRGHLIWVKGDPCKSTLSGSDDLSRRLAAGDSSASFFISTNSGYKLF